MTDENGPTTQAMPAAAALAAAPTPVPGMSAGSSPAAQDGAVGAAGQVASDRPETIVVGAFAAGFLIAMILKRLGR